MPPGVGTHRITSGTGQTGAQPDSVTRDGLPLVPEGHRMGAS